MINFFKKLFGFKATCPHASKETVREILTPEVKTDTLMTALTVASYVAPAKPATKKVRAISDKTSLPTEGKTKGGNNVVKQQPKQSAKPQAPKPSNKPRKAKRK